MRKSHRQSRIRSGVLLATLIIWGFIVLVAPPHSTAEGDGNKRIEVPKDEIRRAIVHYFRKNVPWKAAEVRVRDIRIPGSTILSTPQYGISIQVPPNTRFLGHTPVQIILTGSGTIQKRFWASVYLEVLHPVVVSKRPMAKNQIVSEEDVSLEKRDLAKIPPGAITDLDETLGKRLKRTLGAGTVLRRTMVDNPPLVKRGDIVKLLIETARLKVTALGRVDERGGVGDVVRVINLDSKRRVYGQVLDKQHVRIRY